MIRRAREPQALSFFDCFRSSHCFSRQRQQLTNPHDYLEKEPLADFFLTVNQDSLVLEVNCYTPFVKSYLSNYRRGDCLELFFHTHIDPQNSMHNLFCHHFLCLPDFEGLSVFKEITTWRTGQTRSLISQNDLLLERSFNNDNYILELEIALTALYGFKLQEKTTIGFCYRLHTSKAKQTFFASDYASLAFSPHLWPTCTII